jgi:hypothetical protein
MTQPAQAQRFRFAQDQGPQRFNRLHCAATHAIAVEPQPEDCCREAFLRSPWGCLLASSRRQRSAWPFRASATVRYRPQHAANCGWRPGEARFPRAARCPFRPTPCSNALLGLAHRHGNMLAHPGCRGVDSARGEAPLAIRPLDTGGRNRALGSRGLCYQMGVRREDSRP